MQTFNMNYFTEVMAQLNREINGMYNDRPSIPFENEQTLEVPRGAALINDLSNNKAEDAIEDVALEPYAKAGRSFVVAAVRCAMRGDALAAQKILLDLADRAGETNFAQEAWLEEQRD